MNISEQERIISAAYNFIELPVTNTELVGIGIIHNTYKLNISGKQIILQKINTSVFPEFVKIMENISRVTEYMQTRAQKLDFSQDWKIPSLLKTNNQNLFWQDPQGDHWRAFETVKSAKTLNHIHLPEQATQIGTALGNFYKLTEDLPLNNIHDTMPCFHITPFYFSEFTHALKKRPYSGSKKLNECIQHIQKRENAIHLIENAKTRKEIPIRLIHGDPKINNILFDNSLKKAISIIDLDTIKPGVILYDLGDCLRSACNPQGEDANNPDKVRFNVDFARKILEGLLSTGIDLTKSETRWLFESVRVITLELAIRFLTDYLNSNIYFSVSYPEHNLDRAWIQLKLLMDIEENENEFREVLKSL